MSLVPHPIDHHFGLGIHPEDLREIVRYPARLRSLHLADQVGNKSPLSIISKNGFEVHLDVQQFSPNEITVKTTDNVVIVEGKHEEKEDEHGIIQRHFVRKYTLPKEIDTVDLVSTISSDGILTLKAHRKGEDNARVVHIQQTGPARHSIKHHHNGS